MVTLSAEQFMQDVQNARERTGADTSQTISVGGEDRVGPEPSPDTPSATDPTGGTLTTGSGAITTTGAGQPIVNNEAIDGELSGEQAANVVDHFRNIREEGRSAVTNASSETTDTVNNVAQGTAPDVDADGLLGFIVLAAVVLIGIGFVAGD